MHAREQSLVASLDDHLKIVPRTLFVLPTVTLPWPPDPISDEQTQCHLSAIGQPDFRTLEIAKTHAITKLRMRLAPNDAQLIRRVFCSLATPSRRCSHSVEGSKSESRRILFGHVK
jgi:hypothetical protein